MFRGFFNKLPAILRKLLPTILLLTVAIVAGGTDVFSSQVQEFVSTTFKKRGAELMPMVWDLIIAGVILNLAWLLYEPLKKVALKAFDRTSVSPRGKQLGMKVVQLGFWGIATFLVLSMFASEFMGKFVLGFTLLGAALTLALQGAANDFICGVLMQSTQRVQPGDNIKVIGLEVEGKVKDVGYFTTVVEGEDGVLSVPNRKIWESALKVKKPAPSKLILPPSWRQENK